MRPPSPHLTSAPREAAVWTGTLVLPPTQADVLQAWLMSPARPSLGGKIDPERASRSSLTLLLLIAASLR